MMKKIIIIIIPLFLLILSGDSFCQDIKSEFITINGNQIDIVSDTPISCGYENLLEGRTSGVPAEKYLWLVVHPEGSGGFWPQNVAIVPHPKTYKWKVKFWLGTRGTDLGKIFELWLVLVDRSGNQFYLDYLNKGKQTGKYGEIPLPEGYKAIDMITVRKDSN